MLMADVLLYSFIVQVVLGAVAVIERQVCAGQMLLGRRLEDVLFGDCFLLISVGICAALAISLHRFPDDSFFPVVLVRGRPIYFGSPFLQALGYVFLLLWFASVGVRVRACRPDDKRPRCLRRSLAATSVNFLGCLPMGILLVLVMEARS
jgi:hypothetical protein